MDVAASEQFILVGVCLLLASRQPLLLKFTYVAGSERPVFPKTPALRSVQLRHKHQKRSQNKYKKNDDEGKNIKLERQQILALIEDAVSDESRQHCALREQDRSEGVGAHTQKANPARTIWMGGQQTLGISLIGSTSFNCNHVLIVGATLPIAPF